MSSCDGDIVERLGDGYVWVIGHHQEKEDSPTSQEVEEDLGHTALIGDGLGLMKEVA